MPWDANIMFKRLAFLFLLIIPYQNCSRPLDSRRAVEPSLPLVECEGGNVDCASGEKALGEAVSTEPMECGEGQVWYAGVCRDKERVCGLPFGEGLQYLFNNRYSACEATACEFGFHIENKACVSDLRSCVRGSQKGQQQWQESNSTYSSCEVDLVCKPEEHIEGGHCVLNSKACPVDFGFGEMLWNGSAYSSCSALSCQPGFRVLNQACLVDLEPYYQKYFQTPCQKLAVAGGSRITVNKYVDEDTQVIKVRGFSDPYCKDPQYTIAYTNEYKIPEMSEYVEGAFAVNLKLLGVAITPTSAEGAKLMTSTKFCGIKTWQLNKAQSVATTNACLSAPATLYQIHQISITELRVGLLDKSRDGTSPTLRPRTLNSNPKSVGVLRP